MRRSSDLGIRHEFESLSYNLRQIYKLFESQGSHKILIKSLTHFLLMFEFWQLLSMTFPSSPSTLHLGKLIIKPRCSLLWCHRRFESFKPLYMNRNPHTSSPLPTIKIPSQYPFPILSSDFSDHLEKIFPTPPESLIM